MANYASTDVRIISDNTADIDKLYSLMYRLENMKEPAVKNGFGTTWLGCLVEALGSSWQKVSCRGEWSCLELCDNTISLYIESAWTAPTDVFDLIRQVFPSVEIFFLSTESGCEYYVSNDPEGRFFAERYIVDICTVDEEYMTEYFEQLGTALDWINEQTNGDVKTGSDVETLNERLSSENDNAFCYLHEIEII
jgi:hypothetical protein